MLRRTPIFQALNPEVVSSGLMPDKHPLHMVLWETAENVTFFAGKVTRRTPPILAFDVGANPVRGLSQQQGTDGTRWIWATSGGKVVRWFGPAAEEVIAAAVWQQHQTSTLMPTFFDFTHYGDWTIINSSIGPAQLFKGTGLLGDFGDAPEDVTAFMKKMNFIMAVGYGARGTRVGWSDGDNIEVWTATEENLASALSIDDLDTRIRAASRIGQAISCYGEDQMALVTYIGPPFYFGQRVVLDGIGSLSKSVATDGRNNLGVGRGGVWWTDSNSYRYIDEGWLHDYLQENVNWDQGGKIQAVRNDLTGCYEFFFPILPASDVSEGWSYDPRTGGWSKLNALSVKMERRLFNKPLIGTLTGEVQLDASDDTVTAALALETRPLLMQLQSETGLTDSHNTCRVDEVDLLLKAATNIEFRVKSAMDAHETFEATGWMPASTLSRTYKLGPIPDGVYWKLEFRSTAANWQLDLQGFLLFGAVEGTKRTTQ